MCLKTLERKCFEIFQLDPVKRSSRIKTWEAAVNKAGLKLELLTDIDMLLMVKKRIRCVICHPINRYVKGNNKYMKDYDENKESSYLTYYNVKNLYGRTMSQKFPVNSFELVEDNFQFNEGFTKSYNEEKSYNDAILIEVFDRFS